LWWWSWSVLGEAEKIARSAAVGQSGGPFARVFPEPILSHPFIDLVKDQPTRQVWAGLSLQCVADELLRMAVIWLAIDMVGAAASFLLFGNLIAAFVLSMLAGAVADHFSPRGTMVFVNLVRAALTLVPVSLFLGGWLTFPALMLASVAIASLRGVYDPALQTCVPRLAPSPGHIQAMNGLFDSTHRLARLVGPFIGGLLSLLLPVIHFLTVAATGYAIGALVIRGVGRGIDQAHGATGSGWRGALRRMMHGFAVMRRDRPVARVLMANAVNLIGWILGITLGIPMLMANHPPAGFEQQPLVALSCVLAAYGIGDFASNVRVSNHHPADRWRFMFSGYFLLGFGIGSLPLPMMIGLGYAELPALMVLAFIAGCGGPVFFLPMLTIIQTRMSGADLSAVFRLRIALTSASMALAALAGSWLFAWPGIFATVILAGALMVTTGAVGMLLRPPEMAAAAAPGR
jgi:MFS transporter, DHA3 family, macrolide efflux protein